MATRRKWVSITPAVLRALARPCPSSSQSQCLIHIEGRLTVGAKPKAMKGHHDACFFARL